MIGTTVGDKYAIVRELGAGGMGAVYEARHNGTGRRVAVKVITGEMAGDPDLVARFEVEARAAGAIESEHIVEVLDVGHGHDGGPPFLVMEFLVGEDLAHLFARLGALPADLVLRIGAQALLGLEKAHAQGIIHRDIKPANLFLTEKDGGELRVKLLDFGIAKVTAAGPARAQKKGLTRMGSVIGSPLYMSPEQTRGSSTIDHRTDIWSLGIVLYQALAGGTPFDHARTIGDFVEEVCTLPVTPLRARLPSIDPAVAAAVERALVIDPARRYASAAEMRAALEAFLPRGTSIRAAMLVSAAPSTAAPPPAPPSTTPSGTTPFVGRAPAGATQPAAIPWQATIAAAPGAVPSVALTPLATTLSAPPRAPSGTAVPEPRPPTVPVPVPSVASVRRGRNAGIFVAGAALVAGCSLVVAAYGLGWLTPRKREVPPVPTSDRTSDPPPMETPAMMAQLGTVVGTWWSDTGVEYDAVLNGELVEMNIRDLGPLGTQGYVVGDTHFALRALRNGTFRVVAHVRPTPPMGVLVDHARARTTCEHTWRQANGRPLTAEGRSDKLQVEVVRVEPPASVFQHEGGRVVGCTAALQDAPVTPVEITLSRTPPPHRHPAVEAHDAGAPQDAGHDGVGSPCQDDTHCASHNCFAHHCQGNEPGSRCTTSVNCASRRCPAGVCL